MSTPANTNTQKSPVSSKGLGTAAKIVILVAIIMGIGGGLVFWKVKYGHGGGFDRITKAEMEALLKDANPMILKTMAESPEAKEKQLQSLKDLLSLASAAEKELGSDPIIQRALEFIGSITIARNYDQELHKDSGPMPPFGFITEDQIKAFWGEAQAEGSTVSSGEIKYREELFNQFVDTQLQLAKRNKAMAEDAEPTEEERKQLRDEFAKVKIYEEEAKAKIASDPATWGAFAAKVAVQSKLQRANFLARLYQEKIAEKAKVTDEDIDKYLAENPQLLNTAEKKAKAVEVLGKLNAGGDFAELAKEFSDDQGSKEKGGLYEDVAQGGGFDEKFEAAALALEPGKYTSEPVETQFGFHIIKLEKKGEAKGPDGQIRTTYSVRHILISTQVKDDENPFGREMPAKEFAKMKVQEKKELEVLEAIKKNNPVVIEDFEIPAVSDEQIKQMQQQQMPQMPEGPEAPEEAPKPEAGKKAGSKDAKKN